MMTWETICWNYRQNNRQQLQRRKRMGWTTGLVGAWSASLDVCVRELLVVKIKTASLTCIIASRLVSIWNFLVLVSDSLLLFYVVIDSVECSVLMQPFVLSLLFMWCSSDVSCFIRLLTCCYNLLVMRRISSFFIRDVRHAGFCHSTCWPFLAFFDKLAPRGQLCLPTR